MKIFWCILIACLMFCLDGASQPIPRPNIAAPNGLAVNSFTGNLFYQRNEQSLRGNGYRIFQSFYYNAALDTLNYGYGQGWSFYYNVFYKESGDKLIIQRADARKDTFLLQNGSYRAPAGLHDQLRKEGSQFILTSKSGEQHIFANPDHKKLTRVQDSNGNFVAINYGGSHPVKITNSSGRSLILVWENGLLKEAKDELYPDKKFSYQYNTSLDLIKVTDPLGGQKNISYVNHAMTSISDENANPTAIHYFGSGGRVKQIVSCNSDQRFSYLSFQRKTFMTQKSASGNIVTGYFFDQKGRLTALKNGDGKSATFTYDSQNNLSKQIDFKGHVSEFSYDDRGNLLRIKNPLGHTSQYTYEPTFNKPVSFTDARGKQTTISYDSKGNLSEIIRPGGGTEKFTYDNAGRVVSTTNANNQVTSYEYNATGDLEKVNYPVGSVQYEYNGNCCNVGKITDANGSTIEMTYDLLNRTKTVTDKLGNTTTYDYDGVGNVVKETDPNGNSKEYIYDGLNRMISVKIAAGTWTYDYDEQGSLLRMTDANGHTTTYEYDKKNQLTRETDPMSHSVRYLYDDNGNLKQRLDPNGNVVDYTYDDLGRLTQKSYTGNTDRYSYDAAGNLTAASNDNISYTFEYDDLNRLLKKNILTWNKSLSYTYDALGNRKTMTDHDGGITTYEYDSNNRLISLKNPSNRTTTFEHDAGGKIRKQVNGNGTFTTYHYDSAGRLDTLINWKNATEKISFFYYTFDKFGNRKTTTDKRGLNTYTYDSDYRLTEVNNEDVAIETYSFDNVGNRKKRVKDGVLVNYTYDDSDRMKTSGSTGFSYDESGNMISKQDLQSNQYTFDGENRLREMHISASETYKYLYDPMGNLVEKSLNGDSIVQWILDGDNKIGELDFRKNIFKRYTSASPVDGWLSVNLGEHDLFFHKDGLESIMELSDIDQTTVSSFKYDQFGVLTSELDSSGNSIFFNGKMYHDELSMYDFRSRFYDPEIGRFVTRDSFSGKKRVPLSLNRYSYLHNDPLNYVDPFGTERSYIYDFYELIGHFNPETDSDHRGPNNSNLTKCEEIPKIFDEFANNKERYFDESKRYIDTEYGVVDLMHIYYSGNPLTSPNNKNTGYFSWNIFWGANGLGILGGAVNEFGQIWKDPSSAWSTEDFISNHIGKNAANNSWWPWSKSFAENVQKEIGDIGGCPPPEEPRGPNDSIPPPPPPPPFDIPVVAPVDPNEIIGQKGYEAPQWIAGNKNLDFKVLFENDPDFATAPAQNVTIYVPIHSKINPSSLRISDFGFGSFNFSVPPNTSVYTNRLDVRDSLGIFVDITAGLDVINRRAFWIFQSIDPATGLSATLPADAGFLPVNDTTRHDGEGYVTFSVRASAQAVTGDTTSSQASIIFDTEETILTNIWRNTVDVMPPTSAISSGPARVSKPIFDISWDGQDDSGGTGIRDYSVYFSENSGPFVLFKAGLTTKTVTFAGNWGSKYCFYVIATDQVGNQETAKGICERSVEIDAYDPLPVTWIYFKGQLVVEGALLKWATASEENAEKFVVQRSFDARQFIDIGEREAFGFSSETRNYHFMDGEALSYQGKVIYYRLMQVDHDGATTYSSIVAVKIVLSEPSVSVSAYPNPFQQYITLEILNVTRSTSSDRVTIYRQDGKKMYVKKLNRLSSSTVLLNDMPELSPGIYLLTTSLSGKLYTIKMVKQ